jgi:monoamine oxidase
LILEANNRVGGRGYVAAIGSDNTPIDYGGAWIHGAPTNPLTSLVDGLGLQRARTELDLPYYVNSEQASTDQKKVFDKAVEAYEDSVELAAKSLEDQRALAEYACSEYQNHVSQRHICADLARRIPFSRIDVLSNLCRMRIRTPEQFCAIADKDIRITRDVAEDYVPHDTKFKDVLPLLIANAGPLESAAELNKSSAVEAAHFEAGEDDLIDKGMGAFVEKFGDGLPVCLNSRVESVEYSEQGVEVTAGNRVFNGSVALVTVSVGVLKARKIAFHPELPERKLEAIKSLQMGNMQKVIIPFDEDIFSTKLPNSWLVYEGDLPIDALDFARKENLPLVGGKRIVMGFVIKPLDKNIAIGFFGGDWAKALEKRCEGMETGSGKSNSECDNLSIAIIRSALSKMFGEERVNRSIQLEGIRLTRWSLDATSFGAYSVAEPGNWYQHEILAEPVKDAKDTERLFFAGEGTARSIYNGSFPGAYESGLKAARDISAAMIEASRQTK